MYENVANGRPESALDRPYLARISDTADEAERAVGYIEDFISRCRGNGIGGAAQAQQLATVPSGHFGQLDRLVGAVGRLDALARELQTIG